MKNIVKITESQLHNIIKESVMNIISEENDRHREGYYDDYAKKTGKKDRHSPDYYKKYREKKKLEKQKNQETTPNTETPKKKKDRKKYYHDYNQQHLERLNRGYTKGYKNGKVEDGPEQKQKQLPWRYIKGYDEFGLPITNDPFGDMIRSHDAIWHDDDWEESGWFD